MENNIKILISGYYGYDNIGDEAVLASLLLLLKDNVPEAELVVLSGNVEYTEKTYNVRAIPRFDQNVIKTELANATMLISGGGSLMQDKTSVKSVMYYAGIILMAQNLHIPVVIYGQGLGPINKFISKKMVKHVISRCEQVVWRDKDSKQLAISLGVKRPMEVAPDLVLSYPLLEKLAKNREEKEIKNIIFALRDWEGLKVDEIVSSIEKLQELGYNIELLPFHGDYDNDFALKLNESLKNKVEIKRPTSVDNAIEILSQGDLLVGMRLHSLIMAAGLNLPAVAISYDPKIDAFAEIANIPIAGTTENITKDALVNQILAGGGVVSAEVKEGWEESRIEGFDHLLSVIWPEEE